MKAKNKNSKLFIVLLLVILVGITIIFVFNYVIKGSSKIYHSNDLQFTIMVPFSFSVNDNSVQVDLVSSQGEISIVRNGTNYPDLKSYIVDFDSKRKLTSSNASYLSVNSDDALSRIVDYPDQKIKQKVYMIYVDNAVYIFSTDSPDLYDELDQIAKSFRYTGN